MSKRLATAIDIDASPSQVWEVLSDLSAYREWNPSSCMRTARWRSGVG
jgi:uncharacterized protein YndB with AHSA1/START domain